MRMGNNLVDDETSKAVDTELGREYGGDGRIPRMVSGEYRLEVRKRMDPWKATVESVQRRRKKRYW